MKKTDICLEILSFILLLTISIIAIFVEGEGRIPWYSIGIYFFLTLIAQFPHIYNYPVKVTPENRGILYLYASRIVRWLKVFLLIVFMRQDGIILPQQIEIPVVSSALGLIFILSFYYLIKMVQANRAIKQSKYRKTHS